VTHRSPQLQFCIAGGAELKQAVVATIVQLETGYRLRVTSVEALRQAQHRRQRTNCTATLFLAVAVLVVAPLGGGLPMIPRDERDGLDFFRIEAAEIAVLD